MNYIQFGLYADKDMSVEEYAKLIDGSQLTYTSKSQGSGDAFYEVTYAGATKGAPVTTTNTSFRITYPDGNKTGDISSKPHVTPPGTKEFWIQSGSEAGVGMYLQIDKMNTSILGLDGIDVSTEEGAGKAITAVGKALAVANSYRSKIGAQQNRLEHAVNNNKNTSENTQAAESQIRDADMAKEMVEILKNNILEQVGQSMLAQANQSNQGILSFLQ